MARNPTLPRERREPELHRLAAQGCSPAEIAAHFQVSLTTACRWIKEAGGRVLQRSIIVMETNHAPQGDRD